MEIEKNRKGTICKICRKQINGKKRVATGDGYGYKTGNYYHLSCYWKWVNELLDRYEIDRKQLVGHRNYMIVEKLQDEQ